MFKYFCKRLLFAALALFVLLVLVFFLMQAVPGYPVQRESRDTDAQYLEKVRAAGLLDNVFVQFWRFFSGMFTGKKFGIVYSNNNDVLKTMLDPIKYTLIIAGPAFVLSSIIGVFFGAISAYYRGRWPDVLINAIAVLFISVPSFIFALYLIQLAGAIGLPTNFIPPGSEGATSPGKVIASMITPILSMTLSSISIIVYYTRNELVEVFKQEYVKTALAKGYHFRTVVFKYAMRNALIPIVAILAPSFVTILSGSIIIEKFFNVPGTANQLVNGITKKETNIVVFSAVFYSSIYFLIQILADISYSFIDPRIVLAEKSSYGMTKKIKSFISRKYKKVLLDKNNFLNKNVSIATSPNNKQVDAEHILDVVKDDFKSKVDKNQWQLLYAIYSKNSLSTKDIEKLAIPDATIQLDNLVKNKLLIMNSHKQQSVYAINQDAFIASSQETPKNFWAKLSCKLRYRYFAPSLLNVGLEDTISIDQGALFSEPTVDEVDSIATVSNEEFTNNYQQIEQEMFESVDIFALSHEQVSGKPTTYLKDLGRRFFKSKTATAFSIILGIIVLFSLISSLVNLNTLNNPIAPIPSAIIAYLPPRIPWLGISGISDVIVDSDTFKAIYEYSNQLGIQVYSSVNQLGSAYQLIGYNPYLFPGLQGVTSILGTDGLGRSWWALLWYSTLESLVLSIVVATCSVIIGTIYGAIAGSKAGKMSDVILMRIVEILSGVPLILWILIFGLIFSGGNLSLPVVGISLILVSWMWPSVTARTYIIKYKDAEFVQAAKTLGASDSRILFYHLLPNIAGRLMVVLVNMIPKVIFFEASLVFLGVRSPTDISLGSMIETARLNPYWFLLLGPTLMIVIITLSAQLISNHLNDSLDPKVSGD